jgi:hypothetical protein
MGIVVSVNEIVEVIFRTSYSGAFVKFLCEGLHLALGKLLRFIVPDV